MTATRSATNGAIDQLDNHTPATELAARTFAERWADTHLVALHAIYLELRHGHERTSRHTAVLEEHAATREVG